MSYQVLARKYRPSTLSEVVGQDRTVQALTNAFNSDRLHHAYLLSGTRGVGKTTLARIIAKCLNCINGPTADPCGQCENCVSIADGSFVDLIEVDGASRNKVEDTRDLLDDISYQAAMGRFKVYIIDEVHALSDSSFQTLLKSLEEPPDHVKFVLATTNPESVPVTVRSRCLQFHLRNITTEVIKDRLRAILSDESVQSDEEALQEIARMGYGSMRDALSLTDQAISLCGDHLKTDAVLDMLGSAPQEDVSTLLMHLSQGRRDELLSTSREIASRGVDYAQLLASMESFVYQLAMDKASNNESTEVSESWQQSLSGEWLQQAYQILIMGGRDLQYAPEPRIGFEMTLLRLLNFTPVRFNEEQVTSEKPESEQPPPTAKSEETPPPQAEPQVSQENVVDQDIAPRPDEPKNQSKAWTSATAETRKEEMRKALDNERKEKAAREQQAIAKFENEIKTIKEVFPNAEVNKVSFNN